MVDIWAGCTNFPRTRRSSGGNELLEIDRNSTIYGGNTVHGNRVVPVNGTRNNADLGVETV